MDDHSDDGSYQPSESSDDNNDLVYDPDNNDDLADIDIDKESVASNNDESVEKNRSGIQRR